jgi:hypothetical protein
MTAGSTLSAVQEDATWPTDRIEGAAGIIA